LGIREREKIKTTEEKERRKKTTGRAQMAIPE